MSNMESEFVNYLSRREAQLRVSEDLDLWDLKVEDKALEAWVEIMLKVKLSKNPQVSEFYAEKMEDIRTYFRRQAKINHEMKKLKSAYHSLYQEYSKIVDKSLELTRNIDTFEKEFNK